MSQSATRLRRKYTRAQIRTDLTAQELQRTVNYYRKQV